MRTERNLAVVHLNHSEIEQALVMQKIIGQALSRGRNVVLICDAPVVHRLDRLAFACLSIRNLPGRFAIVAQDMQGFAETMPGEFRDRLQIFESEDDAIDWLDPNPEDEDATLMDLSVN